MAAITYRLYCLIICLVLFLWKTQAEELTAATACVDEDCTGPDCVSLACVHGTCDDGGECICHYCWSGVHCDELDDPSTPRFLQTVYDVTIDRRARLGDYVTQATSHDPDASHCDGDSPCLCAEIQYRIDGVQQPQLVRIDPESGIVTVNQELSTYYGQRFYYTVVAGNPRGGPYVEAPLIVSVVDPVMGGDEQPDFRASVSGQDYSGSYGDYPDAEIHSRHRRATIASSVDNVTFHMEKVAGTENVTDMYVGTHIRFSLKIQMPIAQTTDLLVELFAPDNDTTVMMLCDVEVTGIGSELKGPGNAALSAADFNEAIEMEKNLIDVSSNYYTHAILDFGNITNTLADHNSYTSAEEDVVAVEWDVIMVPNADTTDQGQYWVSAGAAFDQETTIWIGQTQVTAHLDTLTPAQSPVFNLTGPDTLRIGASALFTIDMYVTYDSADLVVNVFAPFNGTGTVSVCSVAVVATGQNYGCLRTDELTPEFRDTDGYKGNEWGLLTFSVVNKGARDEPYPIEDALISVEFSIYVYPEQDIVGTELWIGAAVEVGNTEVWAGQLKPPAVDYATVNDIKATPAVTFEPSSPQTVGVGETVAYNFTIEIPSKKEAYIDIEGSTSSADLRFCAVTIKQQGDNLPCFSDEGVNITEDGTSFTMPLGSVRNTGQKTSTADINYDELLYYIYLVGNSKSTFTVTINVIVTENNSPTTTPLTGTIVVGDTPNLPVGEPNFDMEFAFDTEQLGVEDATQFNFMIITDPGYIYSPMNIKFLPDIEDDEPIMRICKVEPVGAGTNLPCFNRDLVNASITYDSSLGDNVTWDLAALDGLVVCNVGDGSAVGEDNVTFSIYAELRDHPWANALNETHMNVGISYNESYTLVVGQILVQPITTYTRQATMDLNLTVSRYDNWTSAEDTLEYQMAGRWHALVQFPPQSRVGVKVVAQGGNDLSICTVRVFQKGDGLPCLNESKEATYTNHADRHYRSKGELEFIVTNFNPTASIDDSQFDNNSVIFEVVAYMFDASSSSATLDIKLEYTDTGGSPQVLSNPVSLTLDSVKPVLTSNVASEPSYELNLARLEYGPEPSLNVAKGEIKVMYLDITVQPDTVNDLTVKFHTDIDTGLQNAMEMCSLHVIHVGQNIPCLQKEEVPFTEASRAGNHVRDILTLELGPVCAVLIDDTDPLSSLIRVEAAVRVRNDERLNVGDKLMVSSTVTNGDTMITVALTNLTIIDSSVFQAAFDATLNENVTEYIVNNTAISSTMDTSDWVPNTIYDVNFTMAMPANLSAVTELFIQCDVDQSATITVHHMQVVGSGTNLGCLTTKPEEEFFPVYTSLKGTSQTDTATLPLGVLTNTGVTFRLQSNSTEDDEFSVMVQFRLADSLASVDNYLPKITVTLSVGGVNVSEVVTVKVTRDGSEEPVVDVETEINSLLIYVAGDPILLSTLIYHNLTSQAEAYNISIYIHWPPFIQFDTESNNYTFPSGSLVAQQLTTPDHGLLITMPVLYFTDIVSLNLTLSINSSASLPFEVLEVNATTLLECSSERIPRGGLGAGVTYTTEQQILEYVITGSLEQECTESALGMESGEIQDCQIFGSYSPYPGKEAIQARATVGSGWQTAWRGSKFYPYLEVNFGNITMVTHVQISLSSGNGVVNEFQLMYTDDGINVLSTSAVITNVGTKQAVSSTTASRRVRLAVISYDTSGNLMPGLTVEFYGCAVSSDVSDQEVCASEAPLTAPGSLFAPRSFLRSAGATFVCDVNPFFAYDATTVGSHGVASLAEAVECYKSSDNQNWERLDDRVATIRGFDSLETMLYGIATDGNSILASDDTGSTWVTVPRSKYDGAVSGGSWTDAQLVPWERTSSFNEGTSGTSPYNSGNVCALFDGLYTSSCSSKVFDWGSCCL